MGLGPGKAVHSVLGKKELFLGESVDKTHAWAVMEITLELVTPKEAGGP